MIRYNTSQLIAKAPKDNKRAFQLKLHLIYISFCRHFANLSSYALIAPSNRKSNTHGQTCGRADDGKLNFPFIERLISRFLLFDDGAFARANLEQSRGGDISGGISDIPLSFRYCFAGADPNEGTCDLPSLFSESLRRRTAVRARNSCYGHKFLGAIVAGATCRVVLNVCVVSLCIQIGCQDEEKQYLRNE